MKGVLFIRTKKNKLIFLEKYCSSGDLILYNINNPHGCSAIDANYNEKNHGELEGRYSLMVPPYNKSIHIKK